MGAPLDAIEADPDLQALTNVLHQEDFMTYGFPRVDARFEDEVLKALVERSLATTASHEIPCLGLAPSIRWYWGRDSKRIPPWMEAARDRPLPDSGRRQDG
jgi:hypothetical protein